MSTRTAAVSIAGRVFFSASAAAHPIGRCAHTFKEPFDRRLWYPPGSAADPVGALEVLETIVVEEVTHSASAPSDPFGYFPC
jgi:hypothetical protein